MVRRKPGGADVATIQMLEVLGILRVAGEGARLLASRDTAHEALTFAEKVMRGAAQHRLAVSGTPAGWEVHLDPACPDGTCASCSTIRTTPTTLTAGPG